MCAGVSQKLDQGCNSIARCTQPAQVFRQLVYFSNKATAQNIKRPEALAPRKHFGYVNVCGLIRINGVKRFIYGAAANVEIEGVASAAGEKRNRQGNMAVA